MHDFKSSQKTETNSTPIHDRIYQYSISLLKKDSATIYANRELCDYMKPEGKIYQQADTDTVLFYEESTCQKMALVSEKTRTKYYGDLYLEVISQYVKNHSGYSTKKYGWALKNEPLSPSWFSFVFEEQAKDKFTALLSNDYKNLKERVFNQPHANIYQLIDHPLFHQWLNKKIHEKKGSFNTALDLVIPGLNLADFHISKVVVAQNPSYYTIGFTYNLKYITETLGIRIKKYEGRISIPNIKEVINAF